MPLKNYRVAVDGDLIDSENMWHTVYEITTTGAVLVRPDGQVAWRSKAMLDSPIDILTWNLYSFNKSGNYFSNEKSIQLFKLA